MIKPITFPARPVSGGTWKPRHPMKGWTYEPKYNGWRTLVHVPSGTMFNRHGDPLSIEGEFEEALGFIQFLFDDFTWLDCEALERRHAIGQGTLIILDAVLPGASFIERKKKLGDRVDRLSVREAPMHNAIYLVSHEGATSPNGLWHLLQERNKAMGCEFYEGIVAKRDDSSYNIQLVSPDQTTSDWQKFRWDW
jgi:ATP-dependent DNA ligase